MAGAPTSSLSGCSPCDPARFAILPVRDTCAIKDLVVSAGFTWVKGSGFYQFNKPELVQVYKEVIVRDDATGQLYEGPRLRTLIGFREGDSIEALKLRPASFPGWTLFIQSTSVNRILVPETDFLFQPSQEDRVRMSLPAFSAPAAPSSPAPSPAPSMYTSPAELLGSLAGGAPATPARTLASVRAWDPREVFAWLVAEAGLEHEAAERFVAAHIDGDALLELSLADMTGTLGLPLGFAKKVARAIGELGARLPASAAAPEPTADGGTGSAAEWEVDASELVLFDEVGSGAFGKVYRGRWRGAVVAIKQLSMRHLDAEQLASFRREASIMMRLRHPNVVYLLGVMSHPPNLALITEFCDGGALESFVRDTSRTLSQWNVLRLAMGIAGGMSYLASKGVVHRDLATRNVLLTRDGAASWVPKIADFGMSREELLPKNVTQTTTGPLKLMSPEALRGAYSEKSDVFAYSCLLWELVFRREPYETLTPIEVAAGVLAHTLALPLPPDVAPIWAHLIVHCGAYDESARPSFNEIFKVLQQFWDTYEPARLAEEGAPAEALQSAQVRPPADAVYTQL